MSRKVIVNLTLLWLILVGMASSFAAKNTCSLPNAIPLQGVSSHFGFSNVPLPDLNQFQMMGVNSLRSEVFWDQVENMSGVLTIPEHVEKFVKESNRSGILPILVLDYGHPAYDGGDKPMSPRARNAWKHYAEFVVSHFRGRVSYYEIWNEWDIDIGGTKAGTPESYVELVNWVAPSLHQIDPKSCLIVGSATPESVDKGWLTRALNAGLMKNADALSLHTYNFGNPKAGYQGPEGWFRKVQGLQVQINAMPSIRNKPVKLFVTEMGWSSFLGKNGVSSEKQADYAQRLFLLSTILPNLHGVWWYSFLDEGNDRLDAEDNFGLFAQNGAPKMAAKKLIEQASLLKGVSTPPKIMASKDISPDSGRIILMWRLNPGLGTKDLQEIVAIWRSDNSRDQMFLEPKLASRALSTSTLMPVPIFSESCKARNIQRGWIVRLDGSPCIAKVAGGWKLNNF